MACCRPTEAVHAIGMFFCPRINLKPLIGIDAELSAQVGEDGREGANGEQMMNDECLNFALWIHR